MKNKYISNWVILDAEKTLHFSGESQFNTLSDILKKKKKKTLTKSEVTGEAVVLPK